MAQFGEPGSDLKRYKQAGKIGITGSWPSKRQYFGADNQSMMYGGNWDRYKRNYYIPGSRGYKSFFFGDATYHRPNDQYYDSSDWYWPNKGTAGGPKERGYHLFSPLGKYLDERRGNYEDTKEGLKQFGQQYLGQSKTGGWKADDESFAERADRLKDEHTWRADRLRSLGQNQLSKLITEEFRPTKEGGTQGVATDWSKPYIQPFSESGVNVIEQDKDYIRDFGTLEETDIAKIIDKVDEYDPMAEENLGWAQFGEQIKEGSITDFKESDLGGILRDWISGAGGGYQTWAEADRALRDHKISMDTYQQDIEDYENITIPEYIASIAEYQQSVDEAGGGLEESRAALTNPMANVRAGLLQEAEAAKKARYGSGFEGGGLNIDSERRKAQLLSAAQAEQKVMKDTLGEDIIGHGLMEDQLNLMNLTLGQEGTGADDPGTGMWNTLSEMQDAYTVMETDEDAYQQARDDALLEMGDYGKDLKNTLEKALGDYRVTSDDSMDTWIDTLFDDIALHGNY